MTTNSVFMSLLLFTNADKTSPFYKESAQKRAKQFIARFFCAFEVTLLECMLPLYVLFLLLIQTETHGLYRTQCVKETVNHDYKVREILLWKLTQRQAPAETGKIFFCKICKGIFELKVATNSIYCD